MGKQKDARCEKCRTDGALLLMQASSPFYTCANSTCSLHIPVASNSAPMSRQMADDEVLRVLEQAATTLDDLGAPLNSGEVVAACAAVAALQAERDALRAGHGVPRVVDALHLSTGRLVTAKEVESLQVTNLDGWTLAISRGVQLDEATAALEALREQVAGLLNTCVDVIEEGLCASQSYDYRARAQGCAEQIKELLAMKNSGEF